METHCFLWNRSIRWAWCLRGLVTFIACVIGTGCSRRYAVVPDTMWGSGNTFSWARLLRRAWTRYVLKVLNALRIERVSSLAYYAEVSGVLTASIITAIMMAVCPDDIGSTSETSVYFYETTRRYMPESCHVHTGRRENFKSHALRIVSCWGDVSSQRSTTVHIAGSWMWNDTLLKMEFAIFFFNFSWNSESLSNIVLK
jgi:hypothetical protein